MPLLLMLILLVARAGAFSTRTHPIAPSRTTIRPSESPFITRNLALLHQSSRTETLTGASASTSKSSSKKAQKVATPQQQVRRRTFLPQTARTTLRRISKNAVWLRDDVTDAWDRGTGVVQSALHNFWWSFPLLLCAVPLYTLAVLQTLPVTPDFWKLVRLETASCCSWVAAFLASNASYYIAAAYLHLGIDTTTTTTKPASGRWPRAPCRPSFTPSRRRDTTASRKRSATWTTAWRARPFSTFGTPVAHPRAGPGPWALAGLVALAWPSGGALSLLYPTLHSLWHVLSALCAVVWVRDAAAASSLKEKQQQSITE